MIFLANLAMQYMQPLSPMPLESRGRSRAGGSPLNGEPSSVIGRPRLLFDPQPVSLPQQHSTALAEAMRQAAASVAGELQIISSESEAAERARS